MEGSRGKNIAILIIIITLVIMSGAVTVRLINNPVISLSEEPSEGLEEFIITGRKQTIPGVGTLMTVEHRETGNQFVILKGARDGISIAPLKQD